MIAVFRRLMHCHNHPFNVLKSVFDRLIKTADFTPKETQLLIRARGGATGGGGWIGDPESVLVLAPLQRALPPQSGSFIDQTVRNLNGASWMIAAVK